MKKMLTVLLCTVMALTPVFSTPVFAAEAGTETEAVMETETILTEMPETEEAETAEPETEVPETVLAETEAAETALLETEEAEAVEPEEAETEAAEIEETKGAEISVKASKTGQTGSVKKVPASASVQSTDLSGPITGQQDAVNWARARVGQGLNFDHAYGNQCVDLIMYFYNTYGYSGYAWGDASNYQSNDLPPRWTRVYGDYRPGDIAVWIPNFEYEGGYKTGAAGHVGIITETYDSTFSCVNQNFNNQDYCTENSFPYAVLACAIRPDYDTEPPVFHGDAKAYPVQSDGVQVVFEASDNVGITNCKIKAWKYGQQESEAIDFTEKVQEYSYAGSRFYAARFSTSDFWGTRGPFHVACYVYDASGNEAVAFVKEAISFYTCKPGLWVTGSYEVTADPATERCAPYAEVDGENTKIGTLKKGSKVSIVGSFENSLGNLWYQTQSGSWIYSENVKHYNLFMEIRDKIEQFFNKLVFYWAGQAVQKDAALDVASQLSDAVASSNFAVLHISVIRRAAEQAAGAFSYAAVTFDANGGSCSAGTLTYVTGSAFGSLPGAYRFGYTFDGWFTAADGGDIVTADSICYGSQTLYAHWTRIILLEGECGPNLHFVLYGDGILEVTGYGEMTSHPWTNKFAGRVLEAQLPEELTGICSAAFKGCTYLEIINIPAPVAEIKSETFSGCTYLNNVTIPEAVTKIGSSAFYHCETLDRIVIPDAVTVLETSTFEGCISLADVTLSKNLKNMKNRVFANDTAIGSIWIPKSLDSCTHYVGSNHDQGPFTGCSGLKNVSFETGITSIAEGVFAGCTGIEEIVIPDTVTDIETYSFPYCSALRSVTFGNSVTAIRAGAFYEDTALTGIELPDSVTDLYRYAFAGCTSLAEVKLSANLKHMAEWAFSKDTALTSIIIPKKLDYCDYYTDGEGAQGPFHQCSNLKTVTFETGTTVIPAGVFAACTGIEEIVIPNTVTEIEKWSFANCPNLSKVTIGNAVKEIGSGSFYGSAITSIVIPDSVTDLYRYVFAKCTNLSEVKLSKNLKHMAEWVFSDCSALTSIVIPKNLDSCDYYTNGGGAQGPFYHCSNLKNVTFEEGITIIPAGVFAACEGIEEVVIPDTVVELEKYCFANCSNLSKVTMSSQVQEIGTASFYNDAKLTEMTLPETMIALYGPCFYGTGITQIRIPGGITGIPEQAFQGCTALETIDWSLADSLKTISANAFCDCKALKEAVIPAGVTTIGNYAFNNCDTMTKLVVPDSVTSLGTYAFASGEALTDVKLGRGITSLSASLFAGDTALESIIVPGRVTSIGADVFKNAVAFTSIVIPKSVTSINISAFSYPQNLTIYGVAGTYAETFANENDITFIAREVPAEKVTLSETSMELLKNASRTLTLTVEPEEYTDDVIWKSTNTAVATVSDTGLVKAVSGGTATIKVSVGDVTASCTVTVVQPVTSISLSKTKATIEQGETMQLTATVNPSSANNKTILWSSSDESIASVDENGLITANAVGTATITAAAADGSGVKATCAVTVQKTKTICESVDELESTHPYASSSDLQWVYTLTGAEKIAVTFDAQTETEEGCDYIYIYDKGGNQIGKYSGAQLAGKTIEVPGDTITIRLTSDSSVNDWGFKVTSVEDAGSISSLIPATGISIQTTMEISTKQTGKIIPTILPSEANDYTITWTSSNPNVAQVDAEGNVTAKVYGTTVITAKLVSGNLTKSVTCKVNTLFYDVADRSKYWFNPVYWAADTGITNGYEGGVYFGPELNCTREQLITFLYREAGKPNVTAAQIKQYNTFSDVKSGTYYEKPVVWAAMKGITKGYSDGTFGVGKPVTREDTVTFLYRMAKAVAGSKFKDVTTADLNNSTYKFKDVDNGKYYQKPIVWAAKNSITKGYSSGVNAGKFGVGFDVLRGDIVTFLYRYDTKFN